MLQQIAEGQELAFRNLFALYVPFLQPTLNKIVKDEAAADDIIQETFLRIWLYRDKLPSIENPRSWVLRIAYNLAFNFMRNQHVRDKTLQLISTQDQRDTGLEDVLAYNTLTKMLNEAISQMPAQQIKIYRLNREEGMSISEIANLLNLSPQTVKNTLGRAMKFIRDFIEKKGYLLTLLPLILAAKKYF